ncbi:MAG: hypothetical protein H0X34_19190 [Chthoniobacterales bacterium]|nr:hypothetical protein [Chthoniobacterales bacterium]
MISHLMLVIPSAARDLTGDAERRLPNEAGDDPQGPSPFESPASLAFVGCVTGAAQDDKFFQAQP